MLSYFRLTELSVLLGSESIILLFSFVSTVLFFLSPLLPSFGLNKGFFVCFYDSIFSLLMAYEL